MATMHNGSHYQTTSATQNKIQSHPTATLPTMLQILHSLVLGNQLLIVYHAQLQQSAPVLVNTPEVCYWGIIKGENKGKHPKKRKIIQKNI